MSKNKCLHKTSPSVILGVEKLPIGYLKFKLKCLDCGEEYEEIRMSSKGGELGLVGKH